MESIKTNISCKFAKETATLEYKIGQFFQRSGSLTADPEGISEILSEQFKITFSNKTCDTKNDLKAAFTREAVQKNCERFRGGLEAAIDVVRNFVELIYSLGV